MSAQTRYQEAAKVLAAAEGVCKSLSNELGIAEAELSRARDRVGNLKSQQMSAALEAGRARQRANQLGQELLAEVAAAPIMESFEPLAPVPVADFDDEIPF